VPNLLQEQQKNYRAYFNAASNRQSGSIGKLQNRMPVAFRHFVHSFAGIVAQ